MVAGITTTYVCGPHRIASLCAHTYASLGDRCTMPLFRLPICTSVAALHIFAGIVLTAVLLVAPPFLLLGTLQTTLRYVQLASCGVLWVVDQGLDALIASKMSRVHPQAASRSAAHALAHGGMHA